jgi:hypothetical protein
MWVSIFRFFSIFFLYEKSFSQVGVAKRIEQSRKNGGSGVYQL